MKPKFVRFFRRAWPILIPVGLLFIFGFLLLFGWITMLLWNFVLPAATGAGTLNLWQGLALLVLTRILFGWPGKGGGGWKQKKGMHWREKWMNMSEEERMQFKQEWRRRCGNDEDAETIPVS